jgi:hypothetical protein
MTSFIHSILHFIESPDELTSLVLFVVFFSELTLTLLHKLILCVISGEVVFRLTIIPTNVIVIAADRQREMRILCMIICILISSSSSSNNNWALIRLTLSASILILRGWKYIQQWYEQEMIIRTSNEYWAIDENDGQMLLDEDDVFVMPVVVDNMRKLIQLVVLRRIAHSLRTSTEVQDAIQEFLQDEHKDIDLLTFRILTVAPGRMSLLQEQGNTLARKALRAVEFAMTKRMVNVEKFIKPIPYGLDPGSDLVMLGSVGVLFTLVHRAFFSLPFIQRNLSYLRGSSRFIFGLYLLARFCISVLKEQIKDGNNSSRKLRGNNNNNNMNSLSQRVGGR